MVFGNGVKNIQAAAYNGARTVCKLNKSLLKSFQNRKGLKIFQLPTFRCLFLQLAAEKKCSKNGAAGNFFGPSYFVTALVLLSRFVHPNNSCAV